MEGVVLKRYHREDGDDRKYYLSHLSLQDLSLSEICKLPLLRDGAHVDCSRCHDWLCFHDFLGKHVLYNITTKEFRSLPPLMLDDPSTITSYNGTGIGYDHKSDDYKVVRNVTMSHPDGGLVDQTEVYSIKNDSLKEIPSAGPYVDRSGGGVYLRGCFYWVAALSGEIVRGLPSRGYGFYVMCFDFATEKFSAIALPPDGRKDDPLHFLVEYCGCLGVIVYSKGKYSEYFARPRVSKSCETSEVSKSSEVSKTSKRSKRSKRRYFQLWVWKDMSWTKLYDAALHHVAKPLCLIDGRVSFFQGKNKRKKCDLVIYDWTTKEMKRLNICDYAGHLQVFPYVGSGGELPVGAKLMNGLHTEESKTKAKTKIKTKSKAFLQACVSKNVPTVQDKAKPIDTIGEGKTPHFIPTGEGKFDGGLEGGSLEEIPAKRRRKKACKEEDISDGEGFKNEG